MSDNGEGFERRQSFRLDMEKELVDIIWVDKGGEQHVENIACLDFARGGLKLECHESLPVNTAVTVVFKSANASSQKLYGKVLRCVDKGNSIFDIALVLSKDD